MKSNKKLFKLTLVSIMAITLSGCNFNIHWGGSSSSNSTSDSSSENELISSSSDINSANSSKDSEHLNTESSSELSSESSSEPSSESSSEISSELSSEHSSLEQSSSSSSESSVSSTNSSHSSSENKKSYSITYVYNDNVTQNKTIDNLYVIPSLETPSREGYLFEGWYYDEACTIEFESFGNYQKAEDITLYPKFVESMAEIEYHFYSFDFSGKSTRINQNDSSYNKFVDFNVSNFLTSTPEKIILPILFLSTK